MKSICQTLLLVGLTGLVAVRPASAAPAVVALNPTAPVIANTVPTTSVGPANTGTIGTGGYDFFSTGNGDVLDAPAYATLSEPTDSGFGTYKTGSTTMTIGGVTARSGVIYNQTSSQTTNVPADFLTLTLGSSVPASFDLGVLSDYPDTTLYTLSLYGSTGSLLSSAVLDPNQTQNTGPVQNEFYFGNISGATSGDTLVLSGTGPAANDLVTLGGITFDTVATAPEPGTAALLVAGLGALVLVYMRRKTC